jgi:hypothetical protein
MGRAHAWALCHASSLPSAPLGSDNGHYVTYDASASNYEPCTIWWPRGKDPMHRVLPSRGYSGKRAALRCSAALTSPRIPCHAARTPGLTRTAAPLLGGAQGSARAPQGSGDPSPVETPAGGPPAPSRLLPVRVRRPVRPHR